MAELSAGGQALPSSFSGFDLNGLIAHLESKLKPKQEILPNAVYDRDEAIAITGFSLSTFVREEQRRKLNGRWKGRRRYYLGVDLLAWLKAKEGDNAAN